MKYSIAYKTEQGLCGSFDDVDLSKDSHIEKDGAVLDFAYGIDFFKVTISLDGDKVSELTHSMTVGLKNFNNVIIPDCGRFYTNHIQTVEFWSRDFKSEVSHVRTPLYVFCGQDNYAALAFGVVGEDYERDFICAQPRVERALMAYYKKMTLEIRGHIPKEYRAESFTEILYLKEFAEGSEIAWTEVLKEFSTTRRRTEEIVYPYNKEGMMPLWCSWTDWHSDDVTEEVILDNVQNGVKLGIKNYIIDDGWFGPGLDSPLDAILNIGDWTEDQTKIKDLKKLTGKIRALGGKSVIWCAPHAVGDGAKCLRERKPYLMTDKHGALIKTSNKFNVLCLRSPEAREIMADICARLITEYDTDGAKYDLYNCIPAEECCGCGHTHDTDSMIVALERTMKAIWESVHRIKPDYIVELKQNYGGAKLSSYGTMMRAGDTPYSPDGNFMRTAYVQGYTPYAINDYQTITDFDKPLDNFRIIAKMITVGIPTYSMDIGNLSQDNKKVLGFLNHWYIENMVNTETYDRKAVSGLLDCWMMKKKQDDETIYFLVNLTQNLKIAGGKFQILNGSVNREVFVSGDGKYEVVCKDIFGDVISAGICDLKDGMVITNKTGLVIGKRIDR